MSDTSELEHYKKWVDGLIAINKDAEFEITNLRARLDRYKFFFKTAMDEIDRLGDLSE
jgi:hypothetical protein